MQRLGTLRARPDLAISSSPLTQHCRSILPIGFNDLSLQERRITDLRPADYRVFIHDGRLAQGSVTSQKRGSDMQFINIPELVHPSEISRVFIFHHV